MANHEAYLRSSLQKYYFADITKRDILNAIQSYPDLRPKLDTFVFNDGIRKEPLCLEGTIPVSYQGSTYNIPVCIWLMDTHPNDPPLGFVKPTSTMQIKPGRHVDANGRIYLPYLHEWKHWTLLECCNYLNRITDYQLPRFPEDLIYLTMENHLIAASVKDGGVATDVVCKKEEDQLEQSILNGSEECGSDMAEKSSSPQKEETSTGQLDRTSPDERKKSPVLSKTNRASVNFHSIADLIGETPSSPSCQDFPNDQVTPPLSYDKTAAEDDKTIFNRFNLTTSPYPGIQAHTPSSTSLSANCWWTASDSTSASAPITRKTQKKSRTIYKVHQLKALEEAFEKTQYPDSDLMQSLANDLDICENKLKIWFQNKRARTRRRVAGFQNKSPSPKMSPPATGYGPVFSPPRETLAHPQVLFPGFPSLSPIPSSLHLPFPVAYPGLMLGYQSNMNMPYLFGAQNLLLPSLV